MRRAKTFWQNDTPVREAKADRHRQSCEGLTPFQAALDGPMRKLRTLGHHTDPPQPAEDSG
ncbi:MAG: hypothetical protein HOP32_16385 [Nitrospira sp.]|nr:hypothetical protein [Nitrospira sp.]